LQLGFQDYDVRQTLQQRGISTLERAAVQEGLHHILTDTCVAINALYSATEEVNHVTMQQTNLYKQFLEMRMKLPE